jgi:hypothetical protein
VASRMTSATRNCCSYISPYLLGDESMILIISPVREENGRVSLESPQFHDK